MSENAAEAAAGPLLGHLTDQQILSILQVVGIVAVLAAILIAIANSRKRNSDLEGSPTSMKRRPIYWNLIAFAIIGAVFSVIAMIMVDADDRSGIALLFLGLIGGYAASIKELDLAKIELRKARLELERRGGKKSKNSLEEIE